jgi:competence protein ComEC
MAQAGVVHIMAVSGLPVGLVALILGWGARCARMSLRNAEGFSLAGVWLYCVMVGLPASACRAASMVTAYVICRRIEWPAASFGALAAAGFAMALVFPAWAKTPGFQLSFAAAAGVLAFKDTFVRYIERLGREPGPRLRGAATLVGASLGAQMMSWPLVALHFGRTPLLFLVGNAVAVPLVGIVLTWGLTSVILCLVSATLAGWVLAACWAASSLLTLFCRLLGTIPWASASMPMFSPVLVAVYFVTLAAAVSARGRPRVWAMGALAVTALLICLGLPRPSRGGELEVTFLDVGHGDASVFLAPTGETMLVDAGASQGGWDAGRNVLLPYLRRRGVRTVDRAVISHGDGDHWGGLASLVEHIPVKELVLPVAVPLGPLGGMVPELQTKGTTVRWVEAGDTLPSWGDMKCLVIHPSRRFEESRGAQLGHHLNDRSLVLRVTYDNAVILMTGDVEAVAEEWLVARHGVSENGFSGAIAEGSPGSINNLLDCTVLKVPHHGSNTSSSAGFVSLTSPVFAVVSCGPKELFNLPKPQVLERYGSQGVSLMKTVRDGAVVLRTDGKRVTVTPYLRPAESVELHLPAR